jgi:hypothetical protein
MIYQLSAESKVNTKPVRKIDFKSLKKAGNTNLSGEKLHWRSGCLRGRNKAAKTKTPPEGGAKFLYDSIVIIIKSKIY